MKKKYFINLSFQVVVEAESDVDALHTAFYEAPYGKLSRHVSAKVVRVELPIQPPMPAAKNVESVLDAAAGEQQFKDSTSSTFRDPAPETDIPF